MSPETALLETQVKMTGEMSGKGHTLHRIGLHTCIYFQIPVTVNLHVLFNLTELIYRR